jgi:two-component system sensor histidine kinase RegB
MAAGVLVLDTLFLTALLALTGGPANPFAALYVLHVTLAVVVLGSGWGWSILVLSGGCYAALFLAHNAIPGLNDVTSAEWWLHLRGMWLSFVVAGSVIAYFVSRISSELNTREQELAFIQAQMARNEKLSSLSTLAAGAAHELGTPLATIAVVAKELERSATRLDPSGTVAEDARLIREECERCRGILVQMSAKAGETVGEMPGPIEPDRLLADVRAAVPDRAHRIEVVRAPRLRSSWRWQASCATPSTHRPTMPASRSSLPRTTALSGSRSVITARGCHRTCCRAPAIRSFPRSRRAAARASDSFSHARSPKDWADA